jgi:hypothetical protein
MLPSPGQPFTFAGVARYASARVGRLLAVALLFSLLPAAVLSRIAGHCWWPVITEAVDRLPESARIEGGLLRVPEKETRLLAANPFLSLELVSGDMPEESAGVDVSIQLGKEALVIGSLLGESIFPYPVGFTATLDRKEVWPIWGAWKGPLLAGVFVGGILFLFASWFGIALIYAPLALGIARMAGRDLNFSRAWKLSVSAQWPASLLMTFALALYSTGEIGLLFVIIMFGAHFIPSILNVLIAPFCLPKATSPEKPAKGSREKSARVRDNPFTPAKPKKGKNPFAEAKGRD